MCGLAGFFRGPDIPDRDSHRDWVSRMGDAIVHRGPDASGIFLDDDIALVHQRLSILDLSDAGSQPMVSGSGRFVIVFNGEIYNFQALKAELEGQGVRFITQTDTEVLLELYERHGKACLSRLNGMFAFAIWDKEKRSLFIARDRLGKKPLYYYQVAGQFIFGSEIKALFAVPVIRPALRPDAIKDFFAYQYIPDPKTIYANIYKLPPGHWMETSEQGTEIQRYWNLSFHPLHNRSLEDIEAGLYELIDDAVRIRMVSDVPLGAFLSGGVDSSAVVGLMAGHSPKPVTTCTIGFDDARFDEVDYAEKVARQFKTDHHVFTVRETVSDNLATISRFFDEPFADPSFVPTFFVSQLARKQVTVALAGDGGDENFAGYTKYRTDSIENRIRAMIPAPLRHSLLPTLASLAGHIPGTLGRKAQTLLGTVALDPDMAFFTSNCFFRRSVWNRVITPEFSRETSDYEPAEITRHYYQSAPAEDHLSRLLYTDINTYLPGDILVKVDRMSMANSLETRAPLLDYRVVEYAAAIPAALKLKGAEKKFVLKDTFSQLLDDEILYRKKMGFSVPLAQWLRSEIRELVEPLFVSPSSGLSLCFRMDEVEKLWRAHLAGDNRYTQELWSMAVFALWHEHYKDHIK
ncbi:MAG TPA: asparagine synthase (glutamine-hydrolyzing) [Marinobacter sp.]|uniref:asparagine synthase (glutamine-hydrolyzing) n=1 Tax=Marinobacter sp. TaxID=50741 RepID=UPI002D806A0B|nr:asparagine synthase (glutamine-hydrolyzing) [Marinobacter sp.]HET8800081.1 asparagine synthase (glutamine-hydrolyzing) [Marinobacter sp.]